jgi:membrane protease YdiL (CAAX protease family)
MESWMPHSNENPVQKRLILAWVLILAGSLLPEIILNEFFSGVPAWFSVCRLAAFVLLCAAGFFVPGLHPFRRLCLAFTALFSGEWLFRNLTLPSDTLANWLGGSPFALRMVPEQAINLLISLGVLLALILSGLRPANLFLKCGHVRAHMEPVPWMGFPKPDSWVSFGGQYSIYLALGVAAVIYFSTGATPSALGAVIPLIPVVLLMAAVNAFYEEAIYRSALLGALEPEVGTHQAWWMSALVFGIGHFYGAPSGWIGIGLASFMGWILAKAMLETRGFWWSWWIHFLQDVVIFTFLAAGILQV